MLRHAASVDCADWSQLCGVLRILATLTRGWVWLQLCTSFLMQARGNAHTCCRSFLNTGFMHKLHGAAGCAGFSAFPSCARSMLRGSWYSAAHASRWVCVRACHAPSYQTTWAGEGTGHTAVHCLLAAAVTSAEVVTGLFAPISRRSFLDYTVTNAFAGCLKHTISSASLQLMHEVWRCLTPGMLCLMVCPAQDYLAGTTVQLTD